MDINELFRQLDAVYAQGNPEATEQFLKEHIAQARQERDMSARIVLQNEYIGFCRVTSRFTEGEETLRNVLEALAAFGMKDTVPYASTLVNGATLFRAAGRLIAASQLYEDAKPIYDKALPENDFRLAGFYNNFGLLKMEQNQFTESKDLLEKALSIVEKIPDTTAEQATNHTNLVDACLQAEDLTGAREHLRAAERLYAGMKDPSRDPHHAALMSAAAQLAWKTGEQEKAEAYYRRALSEMDAIYGKTRSYMIVLRNLARLLEEQGRFQEAEELRAEAAAIEAGIG